MSLNTKRHPNDCAVDVGLVPCDGSIVGYGSGSDFIWEIVKTMFNEVVQGGVPKDQAAVAVEESAEETHIEKTRKVE
jgi:hypothetical protein